MSETPQSGVLVDTTSGKIVQVVWGWKGTPVPGQMFTAVDPTGLVPGQVPPTVAVQALSKSDDEMARGTEDIVASLLAKGVLAKTDLPTALLNKINVRRGLRGQQLL